MILLSDLQYFGSYIFYSRLSKFTHCIFDEYVVPPKASFFNRCLLTGANGPIILSIPMEGGRNQHRVAKEIRISSSERWQARHWKTIFSAYRRSPWFDHYAGELEEMYSRRMEWLIDWNLTCHQWVSDKMSIKAEVSFAGPDFKNRDNEVVDHRFTLLPGRPLSAEVKRYPQVFEERHGFVPNLSILDWLFCMGGAGLPVIKDE